MPVESLEQGCLEARKQSGEQDLAVARLESQLIPGGASRGACRSGRSKAFPRAPLGSGQLGGAPDVSAEEELAQALWAWLNCVLVDSLSLGVMVAEVGEGDRANLICLEGAPQPEDSRVDLGGRSVGKGAPLLLSRWRKTPRFETPLRLVPRGTRRTLRIGCGSPRRSAFGWRVHAGCEYGGVASSPSVSLSFRTS